MKLLPPTSSTEEVSRPPLGTARHSSDTSRPSGLKLGIVRLGRAGGKVRISQFNFSTALNMKEGKIRD